MNVKPKNAKNKDKKRDNSEGIRREEEREQYEEREDKDMLAATIQEHQAIKSKVDTATLDKNFSSLMESAEKRVTQSIERLETRLAKREEVMSNRLNATMAKRPGRMSQLLSRGKAMKAWREAVKKQNKALFQNRKRQSTVKAFKTQASNYRRTIQSWIRTRAKRIDAEAVYWHDQEMVRQQKAAEQKRQEYSREQARSPEPALERQSNSLERKMTTN